MNIVCITGRLTRDIELKYSQAGKAIGKFTIAVEDDFDREKAHFVDCTCFGKTAEFASQYTRKGGRVEVSGRLNLDTWEKDGEKRSKLAVVVDRLKPIDWPEKGEVQQEQPKGSVGGGGYKDDSIPF